MLFSLNNIAGLLCSVHVKLDGLDDVMLWKVCHLQAHIPPTFPSHTPFHYQLLVFLVSADIDQLVKGRELEVAMT